MLIRSQFLVDAISIANLHGRSFFADELATEIEQAMQGGDQ
jgi:hypothetical protein